MRPLRVHRLYRHRSGGWKKEKLLVFLIIVSVICLVLALILSHVRELVIDLALASATDTVTVTVNDVISKKLADGSMTYDKLVVLEKDYSGNIAALRTDMANVSMLQTEIANSIIERFSDDDVTDVNVPLTSILGLSLLSGRGPRINIKTLSVKNVSADFRNEFSSAGINQTRHQIVLEVFVTMGIFLAGRSETEQIKTEAGIAETVIVGSVPDTFVDFE